MRSVLVPTDFSAENQLLIRFAEGLGGLGVSRIVVGHAMDVSGLEGPVIAAKTDKVRDQLRAMTTSLADAGLAVEVRVAMGEATQEMLSMAAVAHVDAVVCGTHGKTIIEQLFAGSVSEEMLTHAERPTMMVRYEILYAADDCAAIAREFGKSVIVPTDFSASSTRALMVVLDLVKAAGGRVCLLHVLDDNMPHEDMVRAEEGTRFQLENLALMAREKGIEAEIRIRRGDPAEQTVAQIEECGATGLVTGTHGRSGLRNAVLGSVSMALLRTAPIPILVIP